MFKNIVKNLQPLGIVYGDIGTSPIYTLSITGMILKQKDPNLIMGSVSLVFWLLVLIVYVQYIFTAMNYSIRGEGGQLVLREYVSSLIKNNIFLKTIVSFLGLIGFSAVVSEGIITPAISILSAVEGVKLISPLTNNIVITISLTIIVTIILFSLQKRGTDKISFLFFPIMLIWFIFLFIIGLIYIFKEPKILAAINPIYIIDLLKQDPRDFLLIISFTMLSITGVEAMYADMGHLGKKPIVISWNLVFISLIINYLGQGAFFILNHSKITEYNSFIFYMVKDLFPNLYIFSIILALLATVIASQAMISAMFSIFYQTSNLNILPRIKYIHTSSELKHQIYIPFINWILMVLVILLILIFKSSDSLANAYGLTVNITIITTCIMSIIVSIYHKKTLLSIILTILILPTDLILLISNIHKFEHGAYLPILISIIILSTILIYTQGNKLLFKNLNLSLIHI